MSERLLLCRILYISYVVSHKLRPQFQSRIRVQGQCISTGGLGVADIPVIAYPKVWDPRFVLKAI
jgi:hypothetical protein